MAIPTKERRLETVVPVFHTVDTDFGRQEILSVFTVPKGFKWVGFGTRRAGMPHYTLDLRAWRNSWHQ